MTNLGLKADFIQIPCQNDFSGTVCQAETKYISVFCYDSDGNEHQCDIEYTFCRKFCTDGIWRIYLSEYSYYQDCEYCTQSNSTIEAAILADIFQFMAQFQGLDPNGADEQCVRMDQFNVAACWKTVTDAHGNKTCTYCSDNACCTYEYIVCYNKIINYDEKGNVIITWELSRSILDNYNTMVGECFSPECTSYCDKFRFDDIIKYIKNFGIIPEPSKKITTTNMDETSKQYIDIMKVRPYPNPSNGYELYFETKSNSIKVKEIAIYTVTGEKIFSTNEFNNINNNNFSIELPGIFKGIYNYKIEFENNQISNGSFVIY